MSKELVAQRSLSQLVEDVEMGSATGRGSPLRITHVRGCVGAGHCASILYAGRSATC